VCGAASCASGHTNCSGSCVTTTSDRNNCGGCGHTCSTLDECVAGTCQLTVCPGSLINCGGGVSGCKDVTTDRHNCGACGSACSTLDECVAGACQLTVCPGSLINCGGGVPGCKDVTADSHNCGACGHSCPTGGGLSGACVAGVCS
jgi:hypothetical protein